MGMSYFYIVSRKPFNRHIFVERKRGYKTTVSDDKSVISVGIYRNFHNDLTRRWLVADLDTGMRFATGCTISQAVENAKSQISAYHTILADKKGQNLVNRCKTLIKNQKETDK